MIDTKEIQSIINKLRDPKDGCPWDIKQTHMTLLPYLLEETYELIEAIQEDKKSNIKEELGDLLLQILLHTKIEEEKGYFNLQDVINLLSEKLIRRHPHVFKTKKKLTNKQLKIQWENIKYMEGKRNNINNPFYSINKFSTSLLQALEIGIISNELKFDWKNYNGPLKKVKEELNEVVAEKKDNNLKKIEEEIGDLLFSVVNLSRHLKVNPEIALQNANNKFIKRVNLMIQQFENKEEFINFGKKEKVWNKIKKL